MLWWLFILLFTADAIFNRRPFNLKSTERLKKKKISCFVWEDWKIDLFSTKYWSTSKKYFQNVFLKDAYWIVFGTFHFFALLFWTILIFRTVVRIILSDTMWAAKETNFWPLIKAAFNPGKVFWALKRLQALKWTTGCSDQSGQHSAPFSSEEIEQKRRWHFCYSILFGWLLVGIISFWPTKPNSVIYKLFSNRGSFRLKTESVRERRSLLNET